MHPVNRPRAQAIASWSNWCFVRLQKLIRNLRGHLIACCNWLAGEEKW